MKKTFYLLVLFALIFQPTTMVGQSTAPEAAAIQPAAQVEIESPGLPGWPMPEKPIPHHDPGRLSKAQSYTTQVERVNDQGLAEIFQINGLDAVVADGGQPFAGNSTLLSSDQLLRGTYLNYSIGQETLTVTPTLTEIPNSGRSTSNALGFDLAAGDLNGDGQAEQVTAWMEQADNHLYLSASEMPGMPGKAISAPAAAAGGGAPEEIHLLVRGYDGSLWRCAYDIDTHSCLSWDNDGGGTWLSAPAAAPQGDNLFMVFAVGTDNQVYGRQWEAGWSGDWQQYGDWPYTMKWTAPLPEVPALAAISRGGGVELFRLSPSNTLYWFDGAVWQDLGGMLASAPAAISLSAGHMQVFARGMDDTLWTRTYNNGWQDWQHPRLTGMPNGTRMSSAPAVVSLGGGQLVVYARGTDNQAWSTLYNGSSWEPWVIGGGQLASAPAAIMWGGATYRFAQNAGNLLQASYDGLTWQDLNALPSCCTVQDTGIVAVRRNVDTFQDYSDDIDTGYFWGDGRSQVVVGYHSSNSQVEIMLYDLSDDKEDPGFTLEPVANYALPMPADYFRLATGDFVDHDGQDDIAVATAKGVHYLVYILRFDRVTRQLNLVDHGGYDIPGGFQGSLDLAAGDFDADGQDELASTAIAWTSGSENVGVTCGDIEYWQYTVKNTIFDLDKTGSVYDLKNYEAGNYTKKVKKDVGSLYNLGLALAAGDTNGNGKDVLIRTWPNDFESLNFDCPSPWGNTYSYPVADRLKPTLQVVTLPDNADPDHNGWSPGTSGKAVKDVTTFAKTQNSFADRLVTGDFDRDMVHEIVWQAGYNTWTGENTSSLILHAYKQDPTSGAFVEYDAKTKDWGYYPRLAAGAFTGESIRVGQPTYRMQLGMTSPEVLLNLPPMHRDLITGVGEVVINNGATAVYSVGNSQDNKSTSESKRDWSLSLGLEAGAGAAGHKVTASLDATHGENFNKSTTAINTVSYANQTTAQYYDQVIYNGTSYGVWEYPVYGVETGDPDQPATIAVVFPLVQTTTQPKNVQGRLCDENFYTPSHQPYNVWSYDRIGAVLFKDYDPERLIESKLSQGGTDFELKMSTGGAAMRSDSFKNQVSAGLEYSYENELEVPLVGKAWDVSFRASAKGEYGMEEISTLESTFMTETVATMNLPSDPNPSTYSIQGFFYWAKAGYLVVDYQAEPVSGAGSWALYNKADPAFILPWYGFPDPATGQFPTPPHEDAPPCGLDQQLFTHDVEVEPAYAQNGEQVTLRATVRNFSNVTPPSNVIVRFYLGNPTGTNQIASCTINRTDLARSLGPATCSASWTVAGASGEEKIFAVIDLQNASDNEMHDDSDMINNNVGYGLLHAAAANYFDPGLRQEQLYQGYRYQEAPGLEYGLYIPTTNITETVRYELVPTGLGLERIVGVPIQVLAFRGGEQQPDEDHTFAPVPAGLIIHYNNADLIPGMQEGSLKLFRQEGSSWSEAICPGYSLNRFPLDNAIAVPICQSGTYVLSDLSPMTYLFLPVLRR